MILVFSDDYIKSHTMVMIIINSVIISNHYDYYWQMRIFLLADKHTASARVEVNCALSQASRQSRARCGVEFWRLLACRGGLGRTGLAAFAPRSCVVMETQGEQDCEAMTCGVFSTDRRAR